MNNEDIIDLGDDNGIEQLGTFPPDSIPSYLGADDIIKNIELEGLAAEYIRFYGMADHTKRSMASLESMLRQILVTMFNIEVKPFTVDASSLEHGGEIITYNLRFTNVKLTPITVAGAYNKPIPQDPAYCIINKTTYALQIICDVVLNAIVLKNGVQVETKPVEIASLPCGPIPIDIGGHHCVLADATQEQALQSGIDLDMMQGLVIIRGSLYAIHVNEQLTFNQIHVYLHLHPFKDELAWANIISRRGVGFEHSYQMKTRLHKDFSITIEMTNEPYTDIKIPFNILFYMLGISRDDEILHLITSALDDPNDITAVSQIVHKSIDNSMTDHKPNGPNFTLVTMHRDPTLVKQAMIQIIWKRNWELIDDPNERNALMMLLEKMLDTMFLTHQTMAGVITGQDNESYLCRIKKARELARIVRTLILTYKGRHISTDRDHLKNKRFHTVGVQLARYFKRFINTLAMAWKKDLTQMIKRTGFNHSSIATIIYNTAAKISISSQFDQAIQNGDVVTIGSTTMANTLHTEQLAPPKSRIYADAVRRAIAASPIQSKESDRAVLIRAVHSSIAGYNCATTSPDTGEKVGLNKQLAIMTTITEPRPDTMIRNLIGEDFRTDNNLIPWNKVNSSESERYVRVYVNGDLYGSIKDNPYPFLHKYRQLRKNKSIDEYMSIIFDADKKEISFMSDYGRQIRMWPIVNSNQWELDQYDDILTKSIKDTNKFNVDEFKKLNPRPKFFQWMLLTREHLGKVFRGEMTLEDLVDIGILEWIAADEELNIIVADTHARLVEHQHDETSPFTHVFIPISMFGVPSLGCTMPNHSQPGRQTYLSNQIKQTNTYISPSWKILSVRNMYMQRLPQYPLTPTFADDISIPGGQNLIVAFLAMIDNQDDSICFSEEFIMGGGLCTVTMTVVSAECKRSSEKFGIPDMQRTQRQPGNYSLLKGATVPIGTIINTGDVIIAKYSEMTQSVGNIKYIDNSVIYNMLNPAYVYNVQRLNDKNRELIILNLCMLMEPSIGSKFSSRSGNKGVISRIIPVDELPTGVISGSKPDVIINPHSFPSRMLPGEILSDWIGKMASIKSTHIRVSAFSEISIDTLLEDFRNITQPNGKPFEHGYENPYGLELMRNKFGQICSPAFLGLAPRQCVQKFPSKEISTRNRGPIDPITRHTQAGAKKEGGLRCGEMEQWAIESSGMSYLAQETMKSDPSSFTAALCRSCGRLATYNPLEKIYDCANCEELADIAEVPTDYGMLGVIGIMDSMNLSLDCIIEPYVNTTFKE